MPPIPDFDHNGVLPPTLGNPTVLAELSPYPATSLEICERFGISDERRKILMGWLIFRRELRNNGMTDGFQWLDGSFMEDIESTGNRPPKDLDVVTFFKPSSPTFNTIFVASVPLLVERAQVKSIYFLDHYYFDLSLNPSDVVDAARYYTGLFSHRRDQVWKGMLRVDLATEIDDNAAIARLAPPIPQVQP